MAKSTPEQFWRKHRDAEPALRAWYHLARRSQWQSSADLKAIFRSASVISHERVVFNICGNKYRLIVRINYRSQTAFVRFVGTHKEYDAIDAGTI